MTTFLQLRAERDAALAAERVHDAAQPIDGVWSDEAEAESERLTDTRYEIEDRLMATPSPDATGLAYKYLVARGDGREATHWDDMLEREARGFAGTTPTPPLIAWQAALDDYETKRKMLDERTVNDVTTDGLCDIAFEAMDVLVERTPAPYATALLYKMELSRKRWDGFSLPDAWLDAWMADARRLLGTDGGQHAIRYVERERLDAALNALPDDTPEGATDGAYKALADAERWIIDTPATTPGEARVKLRLIADLWHEGSVLEANRAAEIVAEIAGALA